MGKRGKRPSAVDLTKSSATIVRKWTLRVWQRTVLLLLALFFLGFSPVIFQGSYIMEGTSFLLLGSWLALYACRASVALTPDAVLVRHVLGWHRIPLARVTHVEPGYYGLVIGYTPGKAWLSLAFLKPNYAVWLRRRGRSDDIAAAILDAARSARGDS